jgi:hypothetical protein
MITQKARYALRALAALAQVDPGEPMMISEIAEQQAIPKKFLEQILLDLKHQGIVASRRGKAGGYLLLKPMARSCASSMGRLRRSHVCRSRPTANATTATASRPAKSATFSPKSPTPPARSCSRRRSPIPRICLPARRLRGCWLEP